MCTKKRTRIILRYEVLSRFLEDNDTWNEIKDELDDDNVSIVLARGPRVRDRVFVPGHEVLDLLKFWSVYYS